MNRIDHELLNQLKTQATAPDDRLYIDAGVGHLRLRHCARDGSQREDLVLPSNRDLRELFEELNLAARFGTGRDSRIFITGKLASTVRDALGGGHTFLQTGALWLAAKQRISTEPCPALALIEVSASGYTLVGVDAAGELKDGLLVVNPRCGAGTGVNIDRVLQKLGIERSEVDHILADYVGEQGKEARTAISVRADRCGVFGASATISDKNQGIPLAVALATTLKSEVLKVCSKLPRGFDKAVLLGRFFHWQFARNCAEDHLFSIGVKSVDYDPESTQVLDALHLMVADQDPADIPQPDLRLIHEARLNEYPAFNDLKANYEADLRYKRIPSPAMAVAPHAEIASMPLHIGLDVGSTMAKVAMANDDGDILFLDAYSNAGDTIATVKRVFSDLQERGISALQIRSIGITGSARYQVREALARIYPQLDSRIAVLVENYAHAHGSIDQARHHLAELKNAGIDNLNEDFCVLVDIGGEDTKISTLALREAELFNNAMNIKCSAGTGSLMDTLSALFGIPGAGEASRAAMNAPRGYEINATCAVFLMENAQKLQAQGVPRQEILASATWAIVENMARTLWSQIELPARTVVLLHGQTMLSDPLPLAVTHRLQSYLGEPAYSLVPPYPGHRACLGLIRTMTRTAPEGAVNMPFASFLDANFEKRIIQCHGAACEDPNAVCNRTSLKCQGSDGKQFTFTLGGCSAINELFARSKTRKEGNQGSIRKPPRDTYKDIWDFVDNQHPRSEDPKRLVIPRSFVVSEWAYFLARIFSGLQVPVHVDNIIADDLARAQPKFDIDSCAPHMGAVGQMDRLASNAHGIILAPQIDLLDTDGKSIGRTCTLNQGGPAVAKGLAQTAHPDARIELFHLDLSHLEAGAIADQFYDSLQDVFAFYGIAPTRQNLVQVVDQALADRRELRQKLATFAAELIREAQADGYKIALVVGREYMLNPGIYDSHVRRLLRDKQMAAIPSYVLDITLDENFSHIYWRNPHRIVTILNAVAERNLHTRIQQPELAELFRQIESGEDLLPVVQVSTFCCGPDSVTLPLVAELMKKRPFLLIQSDAIIKELAHLENRVNTYVRQLELGLHGKLQIGDGENFEVCALNQLENQRPVDRATDVIYFPTMADNRVLTSVLRSAGFTCFDNYHEHQDLQSLIRLGRKTLGDAVCAPMAGVYGDFCRAVEDFSQRKKLNDPLVAGKQRLLFFDNAGTGPCRQGQYIEMHKLSALKDRVRHEDHCGRAIEGTLRFLVAREADGYNFGGIEEWTLLRMYLAAITHGVLQEVLFAGSHACSDYAEYERFYADYLKMKEEVYAGLEAFKGPGAFGRLCAMLFGAPAKFRAYRLQDQNVLRPLRRFAQRWIKTRPANSRLLKIHVTGEVYMRVAQAEEIFRSLLGILGFGRFQLEVAPVWSYLDYLVEESAQSTEEKINRARAAIARQGSTPALEQQIKDARKKLRRIKLSRWALRKLIAQPLYEAAGLPMPMPAAQMMEAAKEVLPTLRPAGELAPYIGEVLIGLRGDSDLFLNVAPTGCMVSAMGQVFSPCLREVGGGEGFIQHLFSADGEINDEILSLAVLKSLGPRNFFMRQTEAA